MVCTCALPIDPASKSIVPQILKLTFALVLPFKTMLKMFSLAKKIKEIHCNIS